MLRKSSKAKAVAGTSGSPEPVLIPSSVTPDTETPDAFFSAPGATLAGEPSSSSRSTIGSGLKIHGDIFGDSDLFIDGEAQGKIRLTAGRVTVGSNGRVQADIEAREIVIEGTVQGNLKAAESVHLGPASHMRGSMVTGRIEVEDGAHLLGKVEMTRAIGSNTIREDEPAAGSDTHQPVPAQAENA